MTQDVAVPKGERNARHDSIGLLAAGCLLVWFLLAERHLLAAFPFQALTITAVFAVAGWLSRGVSWSGALAGWVIAFILYVQGGPQLFALLFVVFAMTWIATRLRRARKEELALAEPKAGRGATQVMANLGIAAATASTFHVSDVVGSLYFGSLLFAGMPVLVPSIAALAEAAADTVSSEIGKGYARTARLITTMKEVPPGTNGGVSVIGSASGIIAAAVVGLTAYLAGVDFYPVRLPEAALVALIVLSGIFGMFIDSLLGATLERRGYLNNDVVNFLGTASAAGLALLLTTTY